MKCGRNKGQHRVNRDAQPEVIPGYPLGLTPQQIETFRNRVSAAYAAKQKEFTPEAKKWRVSTSSER